MSAITSAGRSVANWLSTQDYLSPKTLFATVPPAEWKFMWAYVGFLGLCLAAGIASALLRVHRDVKERLLNLFWTNALLGGILFFFRYAGVPLLGMDVLRTLQLAGFAFWSVATIAFIRKDHRQSRYENTVRQYKNKYLPKGNQR